MSIDPNVLLAERGSTHVYVFAQSGVQGRNDHVASFHLWGQARAYTEQLSKAQQVRWPGRRFYVVDTRPALRNNTRPALRNNTPVVWTFIDGVEQAQYGEDF